MNKKKIRALMQEKHINLTSWCRSKSLKYSLVHRILSTKCNLQETKRQREVIDALKADGFYAE